MYRLLVVGILLAGAFSPRLAAEEPADGSFVEVLPRQVSSVDRALAWLAKNQGRDGSWANEGSQGTYRMAMTGLAGLAFLSAGHLPGRGPYGPNVERAMNFVLAHQQRDGLISTPEDSQSMYGHGFAMTFLAEVYGMDVSAEKREQVKKALGEAVKLTARAQSSWGGWYYSPNSGSDEGSVTVTQVQALRACANVGINVPPKTWKEALGYIYRSQNSDGGIRYMARQGGSSSVALSAAGAEVLMMGGQYRSDKTDRVVEYLKHNLNANQTLGYHDFYTNFYGTQAMAQIGGKEWDHYYTALRTRLLRTQQAGGSWTGEIGSTFSTSIGVMILTVPYQYLPIFQK